MKTVLSVLLALSVLAGVAGVASADEGTAVGPPTIWKPHDPSSSPR